MSNDNRSNEVTPEKPPTAPNRDIGIEPIDPPDRVVQFDYDTGSDDLAITVVETVAEVRGVPVTEIVPPLSDVVDPVALENVFRPISDDHRREGWVTFFLRECRVVVSSDGWIRVYGPDEK